MPGLPYQSKLIPYEGELKALLAQGNSYRRMAMLMNERHALGVSHNAIFSFLKSRKATSLAGQLFFEGLADDLKEQLLKRICAEWTHDSTAMEGNTLTLGDTVKVLEFGLTISGKPLSEHQEVYGHARAIDLIYSYLGKQEFTENDLFALHQAVMPHVAVDAHCPVGDWKQEFNGTTGVISGKSVYMAYAAPEDVPRLMRRWLKMFNGLSPRSDSASQAISDYAKAHLSLVRIHPFFDGNGRIARLVSNLPLLKKGFAPVVIPVECRGEYIELLWEYQNAAGPLQRAGRLLPPHPLIKTFEKMLKREWKKTQQLIDQARALQAERLKRC